MATLPQHTSESFRKRNKHLYDKDMSLTKVQMWPVDSPTVEEIESMYREPSTNLAIQKSTDEEKLNKLEKAWLSQLRLTYPTDRIGIQSITLKLGDDCRYTPDFWTIDPNGQIEFWEVKGFMRDDAQVKIKIAARMFRWARFTLVTKITGQWIETKVKP